jgi:eukaryotic-like serine/threonine-protein kinase
MADAQERIGQSIGDYRLQRLIGKGTFGTVYLAEHLHDHTHAAVKVLHFPLTSSDDFRSFLKEARTVRLRHPHIVPILDFDLSRDDLPYLVMAYAEGGTLRERYPKGSKLSNETIDTYVQQLASALQYAHDHRVIHRDVKPENMLVCNDGTIQLSDFGIARISEHTNLLTQHQVAGTPAYAAPEQSLGKPCPASDQYALAVVVYEWLTGRRPFEGSPLAVTLQHRRDAPPTLRSICPGVSLQVEQVILKALAKAPQDRFPTITHFAQALHSALQEDAVPTQLLPHLDESQSVPLPVAPIFLLDRPLPQMVPAGMPAAPTETSLPPQSVLTSRPSTADPRSVEQLQSSWPTPVLQKWFSTIGSHRTLLVLLLLCFVLLLGGGGATWLVVTQQRQAHAVHLVNSPLATAAANAYWTGVDSNGVELGFDAAHTHFNPYEQVLDTTNVTDIRQLWSFTTGSHIFSSPTVANGLVYVGSHDGKLYAFDATCKTSCRPLWSFTAGDWIESSPAVVNGVIYFGSRDHKLYALGLPPSS